MHRIKINDKLVRTDLVLEQDKTLKSEVITNENDLKIIHTTKDNYNYTTLYFNDITDNNYLFKIKKYLEEELSKYLSPKKSDKYMIIGLGNEKSTADSLGPKIISQIFVTRYLFELGLVEEKYSNVCSYAPNVFGNTGIESIKIIKSLIREINPTKIIVIDSLKANSLSRLIKTIQITDSGIHPGSGINNDRGEISKKTTHREVIAIGVPTVVDISTIKSVDTKYNNFYVTPTNIDYVIERLTYLISSSLNNTLHKDYPSTNK